MEAPERLTVPTCIGCGAMGQFGTCESGCSEHKLELVRAAAYDSITELGSRARRRGDAFSRAVVDLTGPTLAGAGWETRFRSLQENARIALHEHPDTDEDATEWAEPSEAAITWWCAECGAIDAPQPCLGICVWRPVEWVNRALYERERIRALAERERETRLRRLLRRLSSITPRPDQWERNLRALQAEVQDTLANSDSRERSARRTPRSRAAAARARQGGPARTT